MATSWNKMVEAFMRAINRPNGHMYRRPYPKVNKEAERAADKFYSNIINKANEIAPTEADVGFRNGMKDANEAEVRASFSNPKEAGRFDQEKKEFDDLTESRMDKSLKTDFDNAFDEAAENHGYKKWREEEKDTPLDDGFKGDMHDVNREDAVQRSREEIIKALQQNADRDVTDVLRDFGYIFEE